VMIGYNYNAYDPIRGSFWDESFRADLQRESHTSFAHMPLFGERYERGWKANFDRGALIIGTRGPKDGIHDPDSLTVGRNQQWGGHVVFGDGSITFTHSFHHPRATITVDGEPRYDNLFAMETGPLGDDAILAFTIEQTEDGPVVQFD
jgi:hypothetical protein